MQIHGRKRFRMNKVTSIPSLTLRIESTAQRPFGFVFDYEYNDTRVYIHVFIYLQVNHGNYDSLCITCS